MVQVSRNQPAKIIRILARAAATAFMQQELDPIHVGENFRRDSGVRTLLICVHQFCGVPYFSPALGEVGAFAMRPHQFRHLAGYLYLRQYPGGHEAVRALLGHHSIATTTQAYAGMEGIAAARAYDAVVLGHRHGRP